MSGYVNMKVLDGDGATRTLRMLEDGAGNLVPWPGPMLVEALDESDLDDGKVTFDADSIFCIAIDNKDDTNEGVFTVNGVAIRLSAMGKGNNTWAGVVLGGAPFPWVEVTGSTKFDIHRYM